MLSNHRLLAAAALIGAVAMTAEVAAARDRIASIEFFGYKSLDPEAIRKALPFHEGDPLSATSSSQVHSAIQRITGRDATNVAFVCCVNGDTAIFIGLPGASSKTMEFSRPPKRDVLLSAELTALMRAMDEAEDAAPIQEEVDVPPGYRLMKDPAARAAELKVREYAREHESELVRVLSLAADPDQRARAADALGYADRSTAQLVALVHAARDENDTVRNNVTRALGEILPADPSAAGQVPPDNFIDLIRSGTWSDRNKAGGVLEALTRPRDAKLLARLKSEAWDALLEMARWRVAEWAGEARMILARVAGIPEDRARELSRAKPQTFLDAIAQK